MKHFSMEFTTDEKLLLGDMTVVTPNTQYMQYPEFE